MSTEVPSNMRAVALASYTKPSGYDVATLPTPKISKPDQVLIKVHAASINPIDVKFAAGMAKLMVTSTFPYKLGYDAAGVIAAVGSSVTAFKVGDEVYSRVPEECKGAVAEYVLSNEAATAHKPAPLDFTHAAAIPLAALTALQALQSAESQLGGVGSLKGKTVFVPAGLSGTGSFACQLAKNVFEAGKVITTLSTGKISKAKELLGASTFDQIVDYTKEDVIAAVGKEQVDYMFDTMGGARTYLPIMKKGGVIVTISTTPSGSMMAKQMPEMPVVLRYILDAVDWFYTWSASRYDVKYSYIFMHPDGKGLADLAWWVGEGKVTPIVGRTAKLEDIAAVKEGCQQVYDSKGGVGKFVIEM